MKPRAFDPLRLDVAAFSAAGGHLAGQWPLPTLPRWQSAQTPPQDGLPPVVEWQVDGEQVPVKGGEPEIWLHLRARGRQWLACQRCLQPFDEPVAIDRRLRFVRDEAQAEALDAEMEDDVLALSRSLDLRELVEDELLLALPLVPRHEACPEPLPVVDALAALPPTDGPDGAGDAATGQRPNPFAALAALRRPASEGEAPAPGESPATGVKKARR